MPHPAVSCNPEGWSQHQPPQPPCLTAPGRRVHLPWAAAQGKAACWWNGAWTRSPRPGVGGGSQASVGSTWPSMGREMAPGCHFWVLQWSRPPDGPQPARHGDRLMPQHPAGCTAGRGRCEGPGPWQVSRSFSKVVQCGLPTQLVVQEEKPLPGQVAMLRPLTPFTRCHGVSTLQNGCRGVGGGGATQAQQDLLWAASLHAGEGLQMWGHTSGRVSASARKVGGAAVLGGRVPRPVGDQGGWFHGGLAPVH